MGVFTRPDSPYWWLWLEKAKRRESTNILINRKGTKADRTAARREAETRYFVRMLEYAQADTDVLLARAIDLLRRRQAGRAV